MEKEEVKTPVIKPLGHSLKLEGEGDRWLEIPYADMNLSNFTWLRTWHDGDKRHFRYNFNKDGTISPESRDDLVLGLGDPSKCHRWADVIANHKQWKTTRAEEREKEEKLMKKIQKIVEEKVK